MKIGDDEWGEENIIPLGILSPDGGGAVGPVHVFDHQKLLPAFARWSLMIQ